MHSTAAGSNGNSSTRTGKLNCSLDQLLSSGHATPILHFRGAFIHVNALRRILLIYEALRCATCILFELPTTRSVVYILAPFMITMCTEGFVHYRY